MSIPQQGLVEALSQGYLSSAEIQGLLGGHALDELAEVLKHATEPPQATGLPLRVNLVRGLGAMHDPRAIPVLRECYWIHRAFEDLLFASFTDLPKWYGDNSEILGPVKAVGLGTLVAAAGFPAFERRLVGTYVAATAEELAGQLTTWRQGQPLFGLAAWGQNVRLNVVNALTKIEDPSVRDFVLEILQVEGNQMVLISAVEVLAGLRDSRDIPKLIGYLDETAAGRLMMGFDVRAIVDALAELGDESCRKALLDYHDGLTDKSQRSLREYVATRLGLEPEKKKKGLFGRRSKAPELPPPGRAVTPPAPAEPLTTASARDDGGPFSVQAQALVDEALAMIEAHVEIVPGVLHVSGAGSEGPVMEAVDRLKSALALHPESPVLHFAYSSALSLAAQNATASQEMGALARQWPDFVLARWALAAQETGRWQSLFASPPWGPDTRTVHPFISQALTACALFAVRDGVVPRATLFFRDRGGDFTDLNALRTAKIDLAAVLDRATSQTPVVGMYLRVWDNPSSPMTMEAHGLPLCPFGHAMRRAYEYLCTQRDLDLAIISSGDDILLNRRLPITTKMLRVLDELASLLDRGEEHDYPPGEVLTAVAAHQAQYSAPNMDYSAD